MNAANSRGNHQQHVQTVVTHHVTIHESRWSHPRETVVTHGYNDNIGPTHVITVTHTGGNMIDGNDEHSY